MLAAHPRRSPRTGGASPGQPTAATTYPRLGPRAHTHTHSASQAQAQCSPQGLTWVLFSVWEFNLNVIVPSNLLDFGTFGAHDRSMELLRYGAFYGHLGFLWGDRAKRKQPAKVSCLGSNSHPSLSFPSPYSRFPAYGQPAVQGRAKGEASF